MKRQIMVAKEFESSLVIKMQTLMKAPGPLVMPGQCGIPNVQPQETEGNIFSLVSFERLYNQLGRCQSYLGPRK